MMSSYSVVDTTVLYAAGNRKAQRHSTALEIIHSADSGQLPVLRIPDVVLVETMNGLTRDTGHQTAVDMLDRFREGSQFEIEREPTEVWSSGLEIFESTPQLSLADGVIVAGVRKGDSEYLYSFDTDFDEIDGVTRLNSPDNPYSV